MWTMKSSSSSATGHNDTEISKMSDENFKSFSVPKDKCRKIYSTSSISKAQGTLQKRGPKTIRDKR